MLTKDQIKDLTNNDLELLSVYIKAEQEQRKNAEIKTARDKAVKALKDFDLFT